MKFLDSYNDYLSKNSNLVHGFLFFIICNVLVWMIIYKFRERIIKGLEGQNGLFEAAEVVIFISIWCMPPILFYVAFFTDHYLYSLCFIAGVLGYALMGRYIFDWALAFITRQSKVTQVVDPEVQVKTTTETTVKQ